MTMLAKLLQKRTLTNRYNERPTWLDLAHQQLDAAVAAFEWPADLANREMPSRLLHSNSAAVRTGHSHDRPSANNKLKITATWGTIGEVVSVPWAAVAIVAVPPGDHFHGEPHLPALPGFDPA